MSPDSAAKRPVPPPVIDGADDGTQGGPPQAEAMPLTRPGFPYSIAPGSAITSKRGVLGPGDEVKASDLPGGRESLDQHVAAGRVIKR